MLDWRELDALWRKRNKALLDQAAADLAASKCSDALLGLLGFAQEEQLRLTEKLAHMQLDGIKDKCDDE